MLDLLTDTALLGVLLGLFTPLATSLVQQPGWSRRTRQIVGVLCSVLVGALTVGANGQINGGAEAAATIAAVIVTAQLTYQQLWDKSGVTHAVEVVSSRAIGQPVQ